jgi:hypothetical protein
MLNPPSTKSNISLESPTTINAPVLAFNIFSNLSYLVPVPLVLKYHSVINFTILTYIMILSRFF